MSEYSGIEWTEATWNPITGCSKYSAGCEHCYAERMAKRLQAMGNPNYQDGFSVALHPHVLPQPLAWRKPRMVFVCSMSDLFHPSVPDAFIAETARIMTQASWHTFQVLTKRSERMREISRHLIWPPNVWLGVTVERQDYSPRIDDLRSVPAPVRFVSFEPLLGPLGAIDLSLIDWAIVGGESGPGARLLKEEWVTDLRDQCVSSRVAFFFKQWGGVNKKKAGRELEGRIWQQMPASQVVLA